VTNYKDRAARLAIFFFLSLNAAKVFYFNRELAGSRGLSNTVFILAIIVCWTAIVQLFLLSGKHKTFFVIFWFLQLAYLAVNAGYYHYYNAYLGIRQAFSLLGEFAGLSASGSVPGDWRLAVYLADLPALAAIVFAFRAPSVPKGKRFFYSLLPFVLLLSLGYAYKLVPRFAGMDTVTVSDRSRFIASYGLLALQVLDLGAYASYVPSLSPADKPLLSGTGHGSGKNILLLQIEALDASVIGARVDGIPVMPFLESLGRDSFHVPRVLAFRSGGGTSDTDFTVLNSTVPLPDYAVMNLPGYDFPNSLPRLFGAQGYATGAFHGNIGRYWNRENAFRAMGFDRFWSLETLGYPEYGWGARDEDLFSAIASAMEKATRPFFFYGITMSSHGPYRFAKTYHTAPFPTEGLSRMEADYLVAMNYVDSALEAFFARIRPLLENTVVCVYGDHSEYYVPPNEWSFQRASFMDGGDRFEFVPLFVAGGGFTKNPDAESASLLDIAPTVLEASGIAWSYRTDGTVLGTGAKPDAPIRSASRLLSRDDLEVLIKERL